MQPTHLLMIVATALVLSSTSVFADTTTAFDPFLMRECPQADGTALYTNKDLPGCKLMTLKELSVVPSLDNMPTYRPTVAATPHYDIPPYQDRNQALMTRARGARTDATQWPDAIRGSVDVVVPFYGPRASLERLVGELHRDGVGAVHRRREMQDVELAVNRVDEGVAGVVEGLRDDEARNFLAFRRHHRAQSREARAAGPGEGPRRRLPG